MRLFIGLQPTEAFRQALTETQNRLWAAGVTGRGLESGNLHMTLAFIGEWPEPEGVPLPGVEEPFSITLDRVGLFPQAKVLWAGVRPCEALDRLARRTAELLDGAGIPFDRKPFAPHITLVRKPALPEGIRLEEIPVPPAEMTVGEVCLYRSHREETGMMYTVVRHGPGRLPGAG